jgi:hypothetical protein
VLEAFAKQGEGEKGGEKGEDTARSSEDVADNEKDSAIQIEMIKAEDDAPLENRSRHGRGSFNGREIELKNSVAAHRSGMNRPLYLDSPEFLCLTKETHSVHRLLLEQADNIVLMMAKMSNNGLGRRRPFPVVDNTPIEPLSEVNSSSDEEEKEESSVGMLPLHCEVPRIKL